MRASAGLAALLTTGIVLGHPAAVHAQTAVTGGATIGFRAFVREPADSERAKFLQYRDVPSGLIGEALYFRWSSDSFRTLQVFGRNIAQQDQALSLRANDPGRGDLQLRWDRIPHVFSTNARFLGTESAPGVFTLPTPRPDTATLNHSAYVPAIKERWDPVNGIVTVTPSSNWDFKAEYQRIDKNGFRPMGMAFGGSNNNTREISEPIDQTMNDIRLSQAYTQRHVQAMVSYSYSQFTNALQSVTSDNPLATVDSLRAGTAAGRTALAPNNQAQTITGTVGFSLPRHTRMTGTLSYGWWSQNQAFIPPTINSKNADSLTRAGYVFPTSLNGSIHTSLVNLTATSRPIQQVTVAARYRSYDFKDKTPDIGAPILVISDRTLATGADRERFPYTHDNADINVSVRPAAPFTVSGGYYWDRMDRDSSVRNVNRVTEHSQKFSLDYTGLAWASARLSYVHGSRRADVYHQVDASENPDARRFDEADRNRNSWDLMVSVTPIDQVTLTGTYQVGRDTFPASAFGVQRDNSNAYGAEIDWAPIPRLTVGGGYMREWYDNQFTSRYRTGSTPTTQSNPTWVWIATNIDTNTTAYATFTGIIIPNRLEVGGMWQISKSIFQMQAVNPQTPTGGTAAQNTAATAMTFPAATQELQPLTLYARYRVNANWTVNARYQTEHFTNYDFRTTGLAPASGNHVFEGNNLLPYDAKYFTFTVSFRPGLLRLPRSAL